MVMKNLYILKVYIMTSWFSIEITNNLQKFNGYFSVDNVTNFITSFLDNSLNNLLLTSTLFSADYSYVNDDFSTAGFNVSRIPNILNTTNVYNIFSFGSNDGTGGIVYISDGNSMSLDITYTINKSSMPHGAVDPGVISPDRISKLSTSETLSLTPTSLSLMTSSQIVALSISQLHILSFVQQVGLKSNTNFNNLTFGQKKELQVYSSNNINVNCSIKNNRTGDIVFNGKFTFDNSSNIISSFNFNNSNNNLLYKGANTYGANYKFIYSDYSDHRNISPGGIAVTSLGDEFDKQNKFYNSNNFAWSIYGSGTNLQIVSLNTAPGSTDAETLPDLYSLIYNIEPEAVQCFLENTKILCKINDIHQYVPIQNIKPGMMVKTCKNDYQQVTKIGYSYLNNTSSDERIPEKLYKYNRFNYPELTEDLYVTGGHSILVTYNIENVTSINKLDSRYKLMTCLNNYAIPVNEDTIFTIWHLSLYSTNKTKQYGIYANGLLVESCSEQDMDNKILTLKY
jgi:hypothetical protein